MKKKFVLTLITLMLLSGVSHAGQAYVSAFGGITSVSDADLEVSGLGNGEAEFDTGFNVGGALGYDWGAFRGELEIGYSESDFDQISSGGIGVDVEGDITTLTYLAAVYWDIENSSKFTPYLGVGIGGASIDVEGSVPILGIGQGDSDDSVFAYKLGAGGSYAMTNSVDFTVGYSFLGTSDPDFDGVEAEVSSHSFSAGLRMRF